jgi:hypothetical protein
MNFNIILLIPITMVLYLIIKNTSFLKDVKKLIKLSFTKEGVKTLLITLLLMPMIWALITFILCLE